MAYRKQGAGLSSGSSAAVDKVNYGAMLNPISQTNSTFTWHNQTLKGQGGQL